MFPKFLTSAVIRFGFEGFSSDFIARVHKNVGRGFIRRRRIAPPIPYRLPCSPCVALNRFWFRAKRVCSVLSVRLRRDLARRYAAWRAFYACPPQVGSVFLIKNCVIRANLWLQKIFNFF
jgi:hypothetical protein